MKKIDDPLESHEMVDNRGTTASNIIQISTQQGERTTNKKIMANMCMMEARASTSRITSWRATGITLEGIYVIDRDEHLNPHDLPPASLQR